MNRNTGCYGPFSESAGREQVSTKYLALSICLFQQFLPGRFNQPYDQDSG